MPKPKKKLVDKVIDLIEDTAQNSKDHHVQERIWEIKVHLDGYGEPGYDQPKSGIIAFGNWNKVDEWDEKGMKILKSDRTVCELGEQLEALGVELEWDDEWIFCDECNKAVRCVENSYHWQQAYAEWDGNSVCSVCIKKKAKDFLLCMEDKADRCVTVDLDPEKYGYLRVDETFERGWYEGQAAHPEHIAKALREQNIHRFIFTLDSKGQFDISFSVWIHKSEWKRFDASKFGRAQKDDKVSPAEQIKKALSSGPIDSGEPSGDGIRVVKHNLDTGAVTVKTITPREFVEGKALK